MKKVLKREGSTGLCRSGCPSLKKILRMAKLTTSIFFLGLVQLMAVESYSQQTRLSLHQDNLRLEAVLKMIEDRSEYFFLYNRDMIDVEQTVRIHATDATIPVILDQLLKETGIRYSVENRQIVLTKAEPGMQARPATQQAVTGRVTDPEGAGLPGVAIAMKGTTSGTITDENGMYTLGQIPPDAVLQFSFVGMETQEIPVAGRKRIDIVMAAQAIGIEEVVAVGYGVQKKSEISGSIVSIDAEKLARQSTVSIAELIRGHASGVQITQGSARPGGGSNITIRGVRSLNGGNQPLFVLDGVPVPDIDNVNPADIASIEVLKDASSTAIYGARAANGVILVNTKRPDLNTLQINVDAQFSVQQLKRNFDTYSPEEWVQLRREAFRTTNGGVLPPLEQKGVFPAPILDAIKKNKKVNWSDLMLRDALLQKYDVSVLSGTDRTKVLFSSGFFDQEGIAREASYRRGNFRLNLDHKLAKNFKLGTNIAYAVSEQTFEDGSWDGFYRHLTAPPYATPFDDEGNLNYIIGESNQTNPLWNSRESSNVSNYTNLLANLFAEWEIARGLSYKFNLSMNTNGMKNKFYQTSLHQNGRIYHGNGSIRESENKDFLMEHILTFKKEFVNGHRLDATAVQSVNEIDYEETGVSATNFPYDQFGADGIGSAQKANIPTHYMSERRILSYMGRIRYHIRDKYSASFTMRADGSSVFGAENKFGYFPSASLLWRITEESFMDGAGWLDDLKLRLSYGAVGNQAISPYNSLGVTWLYQGILADRNGAAGITSGFSPSSNLHNPGLKWETSVSSNLGIDFVLLKNSLSGTLEYYKTRTTDLLVNKSLPNGLGYSSQTINLGEVKNSGIEVMLNLVPFHERAVDWNIGLMFSRNVNELVNIDGKTDAEGNPVNDLRNNWFIGEAVNSYYDYEFQGIWQTADQDFIDEHPSLNAKVGDVRVVDRNGDHLINDSDKIIYNRDPKFYASLNSTLKWKNFDLFWDLYWVHGVYKQNPYLYDSNLGGSLTGTTNGLKVDYWTPENSSNTAPRPREVGVANSYHHVTGYQDASYLRLRNITLGYTLPGSLAKSVRMKTFRIYGALENFVTFTDYKSYSPESNPGDFPEPRVIQMGLNITF